LALRQLAISYYEVLNRRDFDAYNVLFADDGTLLMADGSQVPATGNKVSATYFASFEVRNGKIASAHIYFDRMLLAEHRTR
jgi:hypothetical protein